MISEGESTTKLEEASDVAPQDESITKTDDTKTNEEPNTKTNDELLEQGKEHSPKYLREEHATIDGLKFLGLTPEAAFSILNSYFIAIGVEPIGNPNSQRSSFADSAYQTGHHTPPFGAPKIAGVTHAEIANLMSGGALIEGAVAAATEDTHAAPATDGPTVTEVVSTSEGVSTTIATGRTTATESPVVFEDATPTAAASGTVSPTNTTDIPGNRTSDGPPATDGQGVSSTKDDTSANEGDAKPTTTADATAPDSTSADDDTTKPAAPTLMEFIKAHIGACKDAYGTAPDWEWKRAMANMGANEVMIGRIMTEDMRDLRLRGTAREWVTKTVEDRFAFLQVKEELVPALKKQKTAAEDLKKANKKARMTPTPKGMPNGEVHILPEVDADPCFKKHSKSFYKGGTLLELRAALSADGETVANLERLSISGPADFSGADKGTYFMKRDYIAEREAQWAHARNGRDIPVGVLTVTVGLKALARTTMVNIRDKDWQKFVWGNRLQLPVDPKFEAFNLANVMIGPVSRVDTRTFEEMRDEGLKPSSVFPHRPLGDQVCIRNETTLQRWSKNCKVTFTEWSPAPIEEP